jgi:hypothetical protein
MLKKKIWANFQRIIELFTQKIVTKLSKILALDPGSRGQKGTGCRIPGPGSESATLVPSGGYAEDPSQSSTVKAGNFVIDV